MNIIPEPYQIKAREMLRPWHPIFVFDLWAEDGDLWFGIEIRNLMSRQEWILDHFKFRRMTGFFPLEDFQKALPQASQSEDVEPVDQVFNRFSEAVFKCINRFVRDLLPDKHLATMDLVPNGQMDLEQVVRWIKQVTSPLNPWFDYHIGYENDVLSLIAVQPRCRLADKDMPGWFFHDTGRAVRAWHGVQPTQLIGLNMKQVAAECAEIAQTEGYPAAEYKLRKLLYERITNGLYFMRFAIPEPKKAVTV